MTDSNLPDNDEPAEKKAPEKKPRTPVSMNRILIWIAVAGVGFYTLITGIVGMLTKSR